MTKKLCWGTIVAIAVAAPVQADHWQFSYTGFYHEETATWLPDLTITGKFWATDSDKNGIISRDELRSLEFSNYPIPLPNGCNPGIDWCDVYKFNYSVPGGLVFDASYRYSDDFRGYGYRWISGEVFGYSYDNLIGHHESRTLLMNEMTIFTISPIPEPATGMLAGGGALLLGGLHILRRIRNVKHKRPFYVS